MSISIPANAACFLYLVNDISNFQIFNYQSLDPSALTTPLINSLNPHNNYFNLMGYQTTDFINEFGFPFAVLVYIITGMILTMLFGLINFSSKL